MGFMNSIIKKLKNFRKQSYLNLKYQGKYAFVGIGNHSINNLYPVLNHLRVPLKYIVVSSSKNASLIDSNFPGVIGTTDYESVLNDPEIKGILICADPKSHFDLVLKALKHNKNVFIEKPPCSTSAELNELIEAEQKSNGTCLAGMQKRYAPIVKELKKNAGNSILSYSYRYVTGPYPEGDIVLDLFIHPLDLIGHLFGEYKIASLQKSNDDTYFLHLEHNGFLGSIELSTHYNWKNAEENLSLNTSSGVYKMTNMDSLTFEKKSKTLFSIPIEKIKKTTETIEILYNRNSFNPVMESNQLVSSGYYDEIKTFIQLCETGKGNNITPLSAMQLTYKLIENLKK